MKHFVLFLVGICSVKAWFPDEYPYYCNKNTSTREIPPLSDAEMLQVSSLKQVQVILRHGARTLYEKVQCWADYSVSWDNCNVTELMLPSPSYTQQSKPSLGMFRKIYDGSENFLGGNCLTGQLLGEGYYQEEANGAYLRAAYLENSNANLNLFPTIEWDQINTTSDVYLRSDDQMRTLLSAQTVILTLFNVSDDTIVEWHTGDYDLDQLQPNAKACPYLDPLQASIYASPEWVAQNTTAFQVDLNNDLDDIMGGPGEWYWEYLYDCIMTTVCTGRDLPDGSVEQGSVMNQEIYNATLTQSEYAYAYLCLYNDSQWSKLAMGNTAWHIRSNLEGASNDLAPLKLAVFGGHDTTIMPLLAVILKENWDKQWPGYASMLTIELYENVDPSQEDLFRIVYNGAVMLVPGCSSYLCSVNVLLDILAFGEEYMSECTVSNVDSVEEDDNEAEDEMCSCNDHKTLGQMSWLMLLFSTLLFGIIMGATGMGIVEKQRGMTNVNTTKYVSMGHVQSPLGDNA